MSFQGDGAGISGTSNQFQVGYSQGAGYGYGNAAGYAPQAGYANQAAATAQTLQLTSIQGNTTWGWQGQASNPSHLWGSNQGTVNTVFAPGSLQTSYATYSGSAANINAYAAQCGYANQAAATTQNLQLTSASSSTWAWSGQQSNPAWLWGSNQGTVNTVFSPGSLQVAYAGYSPTSGNANGYVPQCGYASVGGNVNGYAPQCGYANQSAATSQTLQIQGTGSSTWVWAGQGGIPAYYWGSNDGVNMYIWQWNQGYVGYSGSAANINGNAAYATQVQYAASVTNAPNSFVVNASYASAAYSLQGNRGKVVAWRSNNAGYSQGISQYQGGSYGQLGCVFSTNTLGAYSGIAIGYAGQYGWQGSNYIIFQNAGAGIILVG